MSNKESFVFLGTGGSMGIPRIGCACPVCQSIQPTNKRLRPSGLITLNEKKILIDCGPDFRQQALRQNISTLDGVIFTHAHHDHTAGLDDLRIFFWDSNKPLPCIVSDETARDLKRRFYYFFPEEKVENHYPTTYLDLHTLDSERGKIHFLGIETSYFTFFQGSMKVNGFRFGDLAYISDIKDYPDSLFEDLKGVKTLILSALRFTPSPLHLSIDDAIEFSRKVEARSTWLTHISHDLDHEKTNAYLPDNIRLAYDGLEVPFNLTLV
jgi:phosphoribosyl 1,2-cyclic phosphate phosphodiesterase